MYEIISRCAYNIKEKKKGQSVTRESDQKRKVHKFRVFPSELVKFKVCRDSIVLVYCSSEVLGKMCKEKSSQLVSDLIFSKPR